MIFARKLNTIQKLPRINFKETTAFAYAKNYIEQETKESLSLNPSFLGLTGLKRFLHLRLFCIIKTASSISMSSKVTNMQTSASVELFIIGNEILIGDIPDTNTNWLCAQIYQLGGTVNRATMLRDIDEVIASEIRAALSRGVEVIITSGGLGPTSDDLTLQAVARAAGAATSLHKEALQMIKKQYDAMAEKGIFAQGGLNPAREKMAWLPEGASPLSNPVGTAPGVLFHVGKATIICLPGVPSELKSIFSTSLQPFIQETFRGGFSVSHTISALCNDESVMEPILSPVSVKHPKIYIKSLATTIGESPEIDITLTAAGNEKETLSALLSAAVQDLQNGLDSLGISYKKKWLTT